MSAGEIQLAVASLHEPFKNVSWVFKINNAAASYFSQPLTPTSCHTSGGFGSRASGLIENYPAGAPTTGVIVQFTVGGVVHYNATGLCQQSMSISSSGYVALSVEFDIPASPVLTSHIEDLVFQLPTNPPSVISMPFSYQALPEPSIDLGRSWLDGSQANGASPEISYTGDEQLFLIVSNLGASSTHKLVVRFANTYVATDASAACTQQQDRCKTGLGECIVSLVTPAMTSLTSLGSKPVQVYWEDLGIAHAAYAEITVYNPLSAKVIHITPTDGYITEPTEVQAFVQNLEVAGVFPATQTLQAAVQYYVGSTVLEVSATVLKCTPFDDLTTGQVVSDIRFQIPVGNMSAIVDDAPALVTLVFRFGLNEAKEEAGFIYHPMPTSAPELSISPYQPSFFLPIEGPLKGGTNSVWI